jgi:hypothetical protein
MAEDKSGNAEEGTAAKAQSATKRRGSRSLFAPVVLIAAGVFFLLDNLGVISGLNWEAAWRYWPLALIFIGLNVLAVQVRPPLGSALSATLGLAAVATFGYLLLSGATGATPGRSTARQTREESFRVPLEGIESAEIRVDLSNDPAEISAAGRGELISGSIFTTSGLDSQLEVDGGHARYEVGEQAGGFSLNPADWFGDGSDQTWSFALSPAVPIDLTIDAGNGITTAELNELLLAGLAIDAGNGQLTAKLPDGDYDVNLDGGNGRVSLALPDEGTRQVYIDGGNGQIVLLLPNGVAARVEHNGDENELRLDDRFQRQGESGDVWNFQTNGYEAATDQVLFVIDSGNGAITIGAE